MSFRQNLIRTGIGFGLAGVLAMGDGCIGIKHYPGERIERTKEYSENPIFACNNWRAYGGDFNNINGERVGIGSVFSPDDEITFVAKVTEREGYKISVTVIPMKLPSGINEFNIASCPPQKLRSNDQLVALRYGRLAEGEYNVTIGVHKGFGAFEKYEPLRVINLKVIDR